jgi:cytochrome c
LGAAAPGAEAAFVGHGGPVKGLALTSDGALLVSTSFDYSVIVWRLEDGAALDVLHGHDAAVNDVVVLPGDERFATAGDDGAILLWAFGESEPVGRLAGHVGRVVDLDVSADGRQLASAGWDHTVRLWDIVNGAVPRLLEGHGGPVNAVRFTPDGERLVTAGVDGALRLWRTADATRLAEWGGGPSAVNALAVANDGRTAFAAGASGEVRRFDLHDGRTLGPFRAGPPSPLFAVSLSPDGERLAATGMDGTITIFSTATGVVEQVLGGERNPLWSLATAPDGRTLFAGGNDRTIRQWSLATGREIDEPAPLPLPEKPVSAAAADGAAVWRRCAACHTLDPDSANRAGPTLHGIFGRRIGTVEGYPYSPALDGGDIVWTEATVADLFRRGPDVVTPGTKMPIQRITDENELAALIAFLRREAMPAE